MQDRLEQKPRGLKPGQSAAQTTEGRVTAATNRILGVKNDLLTLEANPTLKRVPTLHVDAQKEAVSTLTDMLANDPGALDVFLKRQNALLS